MNGRIGAIEADADAVDAVLDSIERSRRHVSHPSFLAAELERASSETKLQRVWTVLDQAAAARKAMTDPDERARLSTSKRDATFLYCLAQVVEDRAQTLAEMTGLRLSVLLFGIDEFDANPVHLTTAFRIPIEPPVPGTATLALGDLIDTYVGDIEIEARARQAIEGRYFRGRSLLYEETINDLARLDCIAARVQEAYEEAGSTRAERRRRERARSARLSDPRLKARVNERVRDVRDLARILAFRYLGEASKTKVFVVRHVRQILSESAGDP